MRQLMVRSEDRAHYYVPIHFKLYSTKEDADLLKRKEPFFVDLVERNRGYIYILGFRGYSKLMFDSGK